MCTAGKITQEKGMFLCDTREPREMTIVRYRNFIPIRSRSHNRRPIRRLLRIQFIKLIHLARSIQCIPFDTFVNRVRHASERSASDEKVVPC